MYVNYPKIELVEEYLKKEVNNYLRKISVRALTEVEVQHIVNCFGGCMTDIANCITAYIRGVSPFGIILAGKIINV